ncbi:MAG: type II secretion system GspH family protein [Candidatus Pacebacteria bacterium]|nr:type II secretion system GspH family protein [Candidatus Paceibacterota bacterium]
MKKSTTGLSLVELLVVITIISILSGIGYASFSKGSAQSRDAERQSDLRTMQAAIELYKNYNGRYPEGCNGFAANGNGVWSGQDGSGYACSVGNQYIVGLAPEYIPSLPTDPKLNGNNSGYTYAVNEEGSVYIIKARKTVESEVVDYNHLFKPCDATIFSGSAAICDRLSTTNNGGSDPAYCKSTHASFQTSYGVWGGFADEPYGWDHAANARAQELTERILCMLE